ncbi:hypothetical protein [Halorussus sp. MSC15.2]|uniref:hypothetical protein n=1 Tax=Halorussus sp. MSC15.2 TaxID=2283638 RepID=UPI0013D28702|nr:hypothetical protein [Halorussus sp. MSC15.2]NEU59186.1 hypothetical protein [Halorussus sp. MSC15.2]
MSISSSPDPNRTTTYAVQFVLEVDDRAFADTLLDAVPDRDAARIDAEGYKTYVDETALGNPAVGASVPFYDLTAAEALYVSLQEVDGLEHCVESGTLAIREHAGVIEKGHEPPVVARTAYP